MSEEILATTIDEEGEASASPDPPGSVFGFVDSMDNLEDCAMPLPEGDEAHVLDVAWAHRNNYNKAVVSAIMEMKENPEFDLDQMSLRFSTAINIERMKNMSVCIIGAGGIGTWLVRTLVGMGIERIFLFDDDIVEMHNIGPQSHNLVDLGKTKVEAMSQAMLEFRGVSIKAFNEKVTSLAVLTKKIGTPDIIISAVDNMEFRNKFGEEILSMIKSSMGSVMEGMGLEGLVVPQFYIDLRMSLGEWNAITIPIAPLFAALNRVVNTEDMELKLITTIIMDFMSQYKKLYLFAEEEGVEEDCTERAIIYTGGNIASYVGALLHWFNDTPLTDPERLISFIATDVDTYKKNHGWKPEELPFVWQRSINSRLAKDNYNPSAQKLSTELTIIMKRNMVIEESLYKLVNIIKEDNSDDIGIDQVAIGDEILIMEGRNRNDFSPRDRGGKPRMAFVTSTAATTTLRNADVGQPLTERYKTVLSARNSMIPVSQLEISEDVDALKIIDDEIIKIITPMELAHPEITSMVGVGSIIELRQDTIVAYSQRASPATLDQKQLYKIIEYGISVPWAYTLNSDRKNWKVKPLDIETGKIIQDENLLDYYVNIIDIGWTSGMRLWEHASVNSARITPKEGMYVLVNKRTSGNWYRGYRGMYGKVAGSIQLGMRTYVILDMPELGYPVIYNLDGSLLETSGYLVAKPDIRIIGEEGLEIIRSTEEEIRIPYSLNTENQITNLATITNPATQEVPKGTFIKITEQPPGWGQIIAGSTGIILECFKDNVGMTSPGVPNPNNDNTYKIYVNCPDSHTKVIEGVCLGDWFDIINPTDISTEHYKVLLSNFNKV